MSLRNPPRALVSVAAGNFHSACVDADGAIWTWGNARHGECGHPCAEERGIGLGSSVGGQVFGRESKIKWVAST